MIASIRKFSKSILAKIFVGIIALPFILWGMGDVFRSGNQNVLAEINETKISTKEFIEYLQGINITKQEMQDKGKEKLINDVLTNYISEKIILIETEQKGISLTDLSLKEILISDKEFSKDGNFLRTKYEKFLLTKGFSAPEYERSITNFETKGQLLTYYSGGIRLPDFIIDDLYKQENRSKQISVIDLEKIYSKKIITDIEIKEFYEKNKNFFKDEFVSFRYIKLIPEDIVGKKDFNEEYFKKIDEIENEILDGRDFNNISFVNRDKLKNFGPINSKMFNKDGNKLEINEDLLNEIFKIKKIKLPSLINFKNNFYIAEITEKKEQLLNLNNKELRNTIKQQIAIVDMIKENASLIDKINSKEFKEKQMIDLSNKNNVPIEKISIKNIKDNSRFNDAILKQVYKHSLGQIFIATDYFKAKKNLLIKIDKETDPVIKSESEIYKKYIDKSNSEYISKVYKSYDKYINAIYKININEKVLQRLINSI